MPSNDLVLPDGSRLLHIGPHKTGTTAIQGSLKKGRAAMAEHDVVYPGTERQHALAARGVTGTPGPKGDPPVSAEHWKRLVQQVSDAGGRRVVVSSESFTNADDAAARTIVDALGGPRVHVVVTLRPLVKIMPSAWQQYVREGLRKSYDDWLVATLENPPYTPPTPTFWHRHRHDVLVDRWASVVGTDNLTVVVVDESDRSMLMRVFEQLVGLPPGLLEAEKVTNPSLTYGEIELVRHLNTEFRRRGWSDELYRALVRKGLIRHLQSSDRPVLSDQKIRTPAWAADRVAEIGREAAATISASGVRVVGDISTLGARPEAAPEGSETTPPAVVPAEAATKAVVGAILAGMAESSTAPTGPAPVSTSSPPSAPTNAVRRAVDSVLMRLRPGR